MDLPGVPLLAMLRQRMTWLNQRQDVLSQNVANADTPGFVARDLKALDFESALRADNDGAQMTVTNERHMSISPQLSSKFEDHETPDQESNPNGNAVSLEQEMIKVSDTQAQFQAATNLYSKAVALMRTAIGH